MDKNVSILTEGRNCWKSAHANRVSFLIDAQAYFDAFMKAIERAERSIIILSWDIDSQMRLRPQDERDPGILIDTLNRLVTERKDLRIFILNWDYAPIYAFERETAPTLRFQLNRHRRIQFVSDTAHPYFASLHQKVAVIDDAIAFSGGLDLTGSRWDTPEHIEGDPRRLNRKGEPYTPFHDVQIAVDDEAARALGSLARERWRRATGERIPEAAGDRASSARSCWPTGLVPDICDTRIAIARTEPPHDGRPEVREVENAYLDSIRAARRSIYGETQYLTSDSIRDAIAQRLSEPDGPEVVLVTPRECSGFIEKQTMGIITARLIRDLKSKDRFHRLRVYSPRNGEQDIYVHAKVMIVDDRWARVASSNLSNRSMGVDNECDIIIECEEGSRVSEGVRGLRNRLLGEHLGCSPEVFDERARACGSLIRAVESLLGQKRTLYPADLDACQDDLLVPDDFADPVRPVDPGRLVLSGEFRAVRRPMLGTLLLVGALMALALAWRFTPLAHLIEPARFVRWGERLKGNPLVPLFVVLAYTILSNLMVPINLLIFATGVVFGPFFGLLYAWLGTFSGAAAGFAIGRRIGSDAIERRLGGRAREFRKIVARRGLIAFTVVRFIPIASFGFVNMLAGAMRVRWLHFIVGTLIGMAPGIVVATIFGGKISDLFLSSRGLDLGIAVIIGLSLLVVMSVLLRYVGRRLQRHGALPRPTHPSGVETPET